jgi:hypothetical protein
MQPIVSKPATKEFLEHYDQMAWTDKKSEKNKEPISEESCDYNNKIDEVEKG